MKAPLPIFDSLEYIDKAGQNSSLSDIFNVNDYQKALEFLKCYKGSQGTFNAYRREIERLLHWCTMIAYSDQSGHSFRFYPGRDSDFNSGPCSDFYSANNLGSKPIMNQR